jgi:UDP-N-acetylmuramate--alanine ligase
MKIFMTGVGGIGMSGLAQLLKDHGHDVSGSDRASSPTTELLESKGIRVTIGQSGDNVPSDAERLIYTEAVRPDNVERMRAKELGIPEISYFGMLGEVSKGKKTIAVSGTNGKTTTTGMTAKILRDAGADASAIVGSITKDFGSNYLPGGSDLFVVEACEYKRDFLTLTPHVLVITNIELEHTDYYRDLADVQSAFRELVKKTTGAIVTNMSDPNIVPVLEGISIPIIDYTKEPAYELLMPGEFNRNNARGASAVAKFVMKNLTSEDIAASLQNFHGTWRRFDYKGKATNGADVYDDYAHHPTAVALTLAEMKKQTKGRVFAAFHPHEFSRTRDLFEGFSHAFKDADVAFIAPIYAAREVDDGTISSEMLAQAITKNGTSATALAMEEIQARLMREPKEGDTIVTMGAGDIYKVAEAITI